MVTKGASGIYAIIHRADGRVYVGKTKNFGRRWSGRICALTRGDHACAPLQADWAREGEDGFEFRILEAVPDLKDLPVKEALWMEDFIYRGLYKRSRVGFIPALYNQTLAGFTAQSLVGVQATTDYDISDVARILMVEASVLSELAEANKFPAFLTYNGWRVHGTDLLALGKLFFELLMQAAGQIAKGERPKDSCA